MKFEKPISVIRKKYFANQVLIYNNSLVVSDLKDILDLKNQFIFINKVTELESGPPKSEEIMKKINNVYLVDVEWKGEGPFRDTDVADNIINFFPLGMFGTTGQDIKAVVCLNAAAIGDGFYDEILEGKHLFFTKFAIKESKYKNTFIGNIEISSGKLAVSSLVFKGTKNPELEIPKELIKDKFEDVNINNAEIKKFKRDLLKLSKKGNNTNNGIYIFPLENGIYELYRSVYTDQKLDCYASGFYIKPQNYPDGIFYSDYIKKNEK